MSQLTSGAHQGSFADPGQAATRGVGGSVLGQIFGSPQVASQISQQAAQMSGVSPQVIAQMMPVVASMLMGGLFHSMNSQGMGGVLGQLASAAKAPGGAGTAASQPAAGGGLFGTFANLVNSALGGAAANNPQATAMQAGLNTLNSMLHAGVQVSQTHQQGLNDIFNSLTNQNRG